MLLADQATQLTAAALLPVASHQRPLLVPPAARPPAAPLSWTAAPLPQRRPAARPPRSLPLPPGPPPPERVTDAAAAPAAAAAARPER